MNDDSTAPAASSGDDPNTVARTAATRSPSAAPARASGKALLWLMLLAAIGAAAWLWYDGQQRARQARAAAADSAQRLQALESRIEGLRRDVYSHTQRLQQADNTNRVLRDEVLGVGQRAAIVEDQVSKLADASRNGAQSLRMDQAELLLTIAQERLTISSDLDGARRAYALAAGVLDGIDAPAALNLRQSLAQERGDLDALKNDPARAASAALARFADGIAAPSAIPATAAAQAKERSWWERALSRFVTVGPSDPSLAISTQDRNAGFLALQLELSLARAAIERRDEADYRAAVGRAETWLPRLWPDSPRRRAQLEQLRSLKTMPLKLALPTLGSTLSQLRQQRSAR